MHQVTVLLLPTAQYHRRLQDRAKGLEGFGWWSDRRWAGNGGAENSCGGAPAKRSESPRTSGAFG
eukprot:13799507-Alexandrium_andersonii.AAC.1